MIDNFYTHYYVGFADFVYNLIDQINDVKESKEREANTAGAEEVNLVEKKEELPFWKVR